MASQSVPFENMQVGAAVIVLNAALCPVSYNSEAEAILNPNRGKAKTSDPKRMLPAAISASLSALGSSQVGPVSIPFSAGARHYVCRAYALHHTAPISSRQTVLIIQSAPPSEGAHWALNADHFGLTERERQTVTFLALGLTSKEIAARMSISPNTVKSFFRLLMTKLGVNTRSGILGKLARPR